MSSSLLCFEVFASLRCADVAHVSELWSSNAAILGKSDNTKDKEGVVMTWATPIEGTVGKDWYTPLRAHWSLTAPPITGNCAPLSPYIEKDLSINSLKKSAGGTVKSALARLRNGLGFNAKFKIRPARSRIPTFARHLLYPRRVEKN